MKKVNCDDASIPWSVYKIVTNQTPLSFILLLAGWREGRENYPQLNGHQNRILQTTEMIKFECKTQQRRWAVVGSYIGESPRATRQVKTAKLTGGERHTHTHAHAKVKLGDGKKNLPPLLCGEQECEDLTPDQDDDNSANRPHLER